MRKTSIHSIRAKVSRQYAAHKRVKNILNQKNLVFFIEKLPNDNSSIVLLLLRALTRQYIIIYKLTKKSKPYQQHSPNFKFSIHHNV